MAKKKKEKTRPTSGGGEISPREYFLGVLTRGDNFGGPKFEDLKILGAFKRGKENPGCGVIPTRGGFLSFAICGVSPNNGKGLGFGSFGIQLCRKRAGENRENDGGIGW